MPILINFSLKNGADIHVINNYGENALICATRNNYTEIFELFRKKMGL